VRADFNRSITLTMATARPCSIYREQVVTRYPANYFGARVRPCDEGPRDRGDLRRVPDRDRDKADHDRGRGEAKGCDDWK